MLDGQRAWHSAWAKSVPAEHDHTTIVGWLPLHVHLADTAAVMGLLLRHWVSPHVVERIASDVGDVRTVVPLLTWLAAVHDVGKISPAFACQVDALTGPMTERGLVVHHGTKVHPQRSTARHERVGELAIRDWLPAMLDFDRTTAKQLASVVGAHHGVPPSRDQLTGVKGRPELVGKGAWRDAREDALQWATDLVGADELVPLADVRLTQPSLVLCAGLVVMADWIASNEDLFPRWDLLPDGVALPAPDTALTAERVKDAWNLLNLPSRWEPKPIADARESFAARFDRPADEARPVQLAAAEVAMTQDSPGLVVVEAPMGEGKTEAALLAAEVLAARSGADGCFVALPTRATSDAMFGRVRRWMQSLPEMPENVSVLLAHSTAELNDEFNGLVRRGRFSGIGDDGDTASREVGAVHRWLRGRQRGAWAQFVVGTVDQILFTALRSRHLMLRHLGLAGKVVIIDEVHAYDVYMSRYLDRALHWLGSYGTPVVLLSATLPAARRAELVRAYESGSRASTSAAVASAMGYPLITASGAEARNVPSGTASRSVRIERLDTVGDDDLDAVVATLTEALADGGCAVVVRNTVARVQSTADRLTEVFGEEQVTVAHSRFLAVDRSRIDADLLRRFGPPGSGTGRPYRHIVVASQVVEQSLDVDFDIMITDLAPVDLVLQRMGRLHRHPRDRPESVRVARLLLTGVDDWSGAPVRSVMGSRRVYGEYALLRSAALLVDRDTVTVPDDISPLVQSAYGDETLGPVGWQDVMQPARQAAEEVAATREDRAGTFLLAEAGGPDTTLDGWLSRGVGDAESDGDTRFTGRVRDGAESLEVVVVQADRGGGLLVPSWVPGGGTPIPLHERIPAVLARQIAGCTLRLPIGMCQLNAVGDGVVAALERNHWTSFDQTPMLSGQLVLVLDDDRSADLHHGAAHFRLTYDLKRGLTTQDLRESG